MSAFEIAVIVAGMTGFALAAGWRWSRPGTLLDRPGAVLVGAAWVAAATVEYWLFGPFSYAATNAELDFAPLIQQFLVKTHGGGQFTHAFTGGNDTQGLGTFVGQFVALDRLLLTVLPVWAVLGLIHVAQVALAVAGTYLLCRRAWQAERPLALALGAAYSLSNTYFFKITFTHGLSFALIPILVYVIVARAGRARRYWPLVALVSGLYAVSCSPTHSGPPTVAALILSMVLLTPRPAWRPLAAMGILLAMLVANWHEAVWAKAQLAPWAFRSSQVDLTRSAAEAVERFVGSLLTFDPHEVPLAWIALGLLAFGRHPRWWRHALVLAAAAGGGALVQNLPWAAVGLKVVAALNWERVAFALGLMVLLTLAAAATRPRAARLAAAVAFGLAGAELAVVKLYNLSTWLALGGQAVVTQGLDDIRRAAPHGDHPVRVVSIPYRLPSNLAAVVGLHTLDGMLNLNLTSLSNFWLHAVLRHKGDAESSYVSLLTPAWDEKCCASYDLDDHADLAMLRMMNVGYVLSRLPLTGEGIRQVSGPPAGTDLPARRTQPAADRLTAYLREMVRTPPLRVYSIGTPLPRVYAASQVVPTDLAAGDPAFFALVRQHGPHGRAVMAGQDGAAFAAGDGMAVEEFALPPDGVTARVQAPRGGTLLVGIPFTPWWSATVDGHAAALALANGGQMAVMVPPGGREVTLRYHRPLMREKLLGAGPGPRP
jgi:hypothetical protein